MTEEEKNLLERFSDFRKAFYAFSEAWHEIDGSSKMHDIMTEGYPFKLSFDEIPIPDWYDQVIEKTKEIYEK